MQTETAARPRSGSLVLDGHKSHKRLSRRCEAGWLQWPCKRRTCAVCGPRRKRLTARMLMLDAAVEPPRYTITLTTRDPDTSDHAFREGSKAVWQRLRRKYGRVDYFGSVEWTTGTARLSGGHRRMHCHYLVKAEFDDVRLVEHEVREAWSASMENHGSPAWVVEVAELIVPGAAIHYLNLHHRKPAQAPPAGWSGRVERASRGYFSEPSPKLRDRAQLELAVEAIRWATGVDEGDARFIAQQRVERREELRLERASVAAALREERAGRRRMQPPPPSDQRTLFQKR